MEDLSAQIFVLLQLVFWLSLIFLGCFWLISRLFPRNRLAKQISRKVFRVIFIEPPKQAYGAARWLIVKLLESTPQYRLRQVYLENYQVTPLQFYDMIEQVFAERQIVGAAIWRVTRIEWHLFSTRRIYLLIRFHDVMCFLSGVTLGTSFLISWRYTATPGKVLLVLFQMPYIGAITEKLLKPPTFYRTDVYHAFEQAVRATVLEAANLLTGQGIRPLAEDEQRPLLREFYGD